MRLKVKDKPQNSEEMRANSWGKLRSYLAKRGYSQEWIKDAIGDNRKGRNKLQIMEKIQEARGTVRRELVRYNCLIEVPDDLDVLEQHEVEYEAEVPVMRTVEYEVDVPVMETVTHEEEYLDENGDTQTHTWTTEEPTGETETVTKSYQEDTGETEIATRARMEYLLGDDVVWELSNLYTAWPALVTPGTRLDNPTKLMHCKITTDAEDVETYIGSLIEGYALDWTLLHIQSYHPVEEYTAMETRPIMELVTVTEIITDPEPQEEIEVERGEWQPTGKTEDVEVTKSRAKVFLSTSLRDIEDYIPPRYSDEEKKKELDKDISWLHIYQGMAPWRLT